MGSYASLARQSLGLGVFALLVTFFAPDEARPWCLGLGIGALIFFIGISLWRHHQIRRLSSEADRVLHSGHRVPFAKCQEGDVAILANEMEKMVARLANTTTQLRQERGTLADALADISHQIRTPLTAAELTLNAIERADDPHERKRLVRNTEALLERAGWLVTTLLKIAKADAGAIAVSASPVSVSAVVRRAIVPLEVAFDLRDITLELHIDEAASFIGDELWTAEALENILKNCMEHTPSGGRVIIGGSEDALATTITISDTGAGIAKEDLPHVFERFYRGRQEEQPPSSEEESASNGFGIGLALAQALVSAQEGTIRASNGSDGGACFSIAFPKLVV